MAKPVVKKPVTKIPPPKMTREQLNKMYEDAAVRADSGNINRIQLEKGENTVRVVDPFFRENFCAYIEDTEGNTKKINMGIDPNENKNKYAILFEKIPDVQISHRYYFKAIQGKKVKTDKGERVVMDKEVKLLEIGPSIFKQMSAIQADPEYGDIDEMNIKIKRTGEKLKTEYNVMPSPTKTPLPKDLTGDVDLDALVAETSLEAVYSYLGEEYDGETTETEEVDETTEAVDDITEEVDEVEEVVEETETEPETDGDGFDDMDRKELKAYIKQYELGITVYSNWDDDQIRNAIRAKLSELEAEVETDEVEEVVEETTEDEPTVEEDDLSDLDDLDDEEPPTPPVKKSTVKKKK